MEQFENGQVDLSAKEQVVLDYMREKLKATAPNLNVGDRSPFMETFGLTHLELMKPIFEKADRFLLMQKLDNAARMTDEEMDFLGERFGKERLAGTSSTGLGYFVYNDLPKDGMVVIPADYQVSSVHGHTFYTTTTRTISESQMAQYFVPERFVYRVPVPLTSVSPGADKNIKAGELQHGISPLPNLANIENDEPFVFGSDKETNTEFADRIRIEGHSQGYGQESGYKAYVRRFKGAEETCVAGYRHPLMRRDIIGTYEQNTSLNQSVRDVHWGTKVDLYIRGLDLETMVETLPVTELPEGGLGATLNMRPVFDVVQVRFFLYDGQLDDPAMEQENSYVQDFVLEKREDFEDEGTLDERAFVRIFDGRVTTAHRIEVRYRYNRLIQNVFDGFYLYEDRPPTTDIKPKMAHAKYVYGSMTVKPSVPGGLSERDRYLITSRMREMFKAQRLGIPLQFSDIQASITEQAVWKEDALNLIDSIRIPATTFFVAKNPSQYAYYTLGAAQRAFIDSVRSEQGQLDYVFTRYRDVFKTYDLFDTIHAMLIDDDLEVSMRELATDGTVSAQNVMMFLEMKKAFDASLAIKMLMPNELPCDEHEHFELGDVYVQDDIRYATTEWRQVLSVVTAVALAGEASDESYSELLDLLLLILTLVFVNHHGNDVIGREAELYRFLDRALKDTPYRGRIALRGDETDGA